MYPGNLHRVLAILLLHVFSLSLITPLLGAAEQEANLPQCCRRDGKHGCGMAKGKGAGAGSLSGPAVQSVKPVCPMFPNGKSEPVTSPLALPVPERMEISLLFSAEAGRAQTEARYRVSHSRASQKRGPPAV